MLENLLIPIGKSLISPFMSLISWTYGKFKRPSIELKKAPANFFFHIKPGVTVERMREILGAPHKNIGEDYLYSFRDLRVQISIDNENSIRSISAALTNISRLSRFSIPPLSYILGKTTFLDVLEDESPIHSDLSSKFYHYWTEAYYGSWGGYFYYSFGVLEAPGIASPPGKFWSPNTQTRSEIPKDKRINWVSISISEGIPAFNYLSFM